MSRPRARILVVEDDRGTADLIALYLRHEGHRVQVEHAGDRALERLVDERFDLLILDGMLPGTDGLEICRRVRSRAGTPIIMVTARTREEDRIEGLEGGADDYVSKPFRPRELMARVHAALRRTPPTGSHPLRRGIFVLDPAASSVTVAGRSVSLTPTEYALLEALARHPGHILSRTQLLDAFPGDRRGTSERTVDVHVRNLRQKVEPDPDEPRYIRTAVGLGYRLEPRESG